MLDVLFMSFHVFKIFRIDLAKFIEKTFPIFIPNTQILCYVFSFPFLSNYRTEKLLQKASKNTKSQANVF
jgi:hypothetical protein